MNKEEILKELRADEAAGYGEIIVETEKGVQYFNYESSWGHHNLFFRDEHFCTKEELLNLIFVSENSRKYGVNESYVANILIDAFKDCLADMMTTLRCVAVVHGQEDLEAVFEFCHIEMDNDIDLSENVGYMVYDAQICIVNEKEILNVLSDLNPLDNGEYGIRDYEDGIGVTLIHECRHQMLDCNIFISKEKYPGHLSSEDAVEDFARNRWDEIRSSHRLVSGNLEELNKV